MAAAAEFVFFFLSLFTSANIFLGFLFLVFFSSHGGGDPCLLLSEEGTVQGRGSLPLFLY